MTDTDSIEQGRIQQLLDAVKRAEDEALATAIYPELKKLARFQLMGEQPEHTPNTAAIVH